MAVSELWTDLSVFPPKENVAFPIIPGQKEYVVVRWGKEIEMGDFEGPVDYEMAAYHMHDRGTLVKMYAQFNDCTVGTGKILNVCNCIYARVNQLELWKPTTWHYMDSTVGIRKGWREAFMNDSLWIPLDDDDILQPKFHFVNEEGSEACDTQMQLWAYIIKAD